MLFSNVASRIVWRYQIAQYNNSNMQRKFHKWFLFFFFWVKKRNCINFSDKFHFLKVASQFVRWSFKKKYRTPWPLILSKIIMLKVIIKYKQILFDFELLKINICQGLFTRRLIKIDSWLHEFIANACSLLVTQRDMLISSKMF